MNKIYLFFYNVDTLPVKSDCSNTFNYNLVFSIFNSIINVNIINIIIALVKCFVHSLG